MMPMTDHYAYLAEAALSHLSDAHCLRDSTIPCERLRCILFARSARCALSALLSAQGSQHHACTLNLLTPVASLDRQGRYFGRRLDKAQQHARQLSRVLILDQLDAGAGYVTRDLFDARDVQACEAAAVFFVDTCCQRLLRCTWEQALIRFHPFRVPPMTDTTLWQRRHPATRPGNHSVRTLS